MARSASRSSPVYSRTLKCDCGKDSVFGCTAIGAIFDTTENVFLKCADDLPTAKISSFRASEESLRPVPGESDETIDLIRGISRRGLFGMTAIFGDGSSSS